MASDANIEQLHDDERVALEGIYGSNVKFPEQIWKIWRPLEVTIHLEPIDVVQSSQDRTPPSLDLHVTCSREYPLRVPNIVFENVKFVVQAQLQALQQKLVDKAKQLLGNVMIMELCDEVRAFLSELEHAPVGSFHDNMMKTIANKEQEMKRKRADSERREVEKLQEERERMTLELQLKRDEMQRLQALNRVEGEFRMIGGKRIVVLNNAPNRRKRLHSLCREWMGFFNNEQLLIAEWNFRYTLGRNPQESKKRDFKSFMKKLTEACDEMNALCELPSVDPNLVGYAFVHLQANFVADSNINVQVFVAQRLLADEENLTNVFNVVASNSSLMRRLAAQAVCGLRWLHEQQLSHSAVSPKVVWLRDNVFRFSDFGTLSTLVELADWFGEIISGRLATPEVDEKKSAPRKRDLFQLGTMLDGLSLEAHGTSDFSRVPSPAMTRCDTPTQLARFVAKCQEAKNIDQLVEDPYLIQDLPISGASDQSSLIGGGMDARSRLMKEFFVIRMLGKGGFGDVLLARNKLDSSDYAVKRIPLASGSERLNRRIKREAKLFAKLNHPHVVRYYSAWMEELLPVERKTSKTSVSSTATTTSDGASMGWEKNNKANAVGTKVGHATRKKKKREKKKKSDMAPKIDTIQCGDSLLPAHLRNLEMETAAALNRSIRNVVEPSEWSTSYTVHAQGDSFSTEDDEDEDDVEEDEDDDDDGGDHGVDVKSVGSPGHRVETLFSPIGGTSTADDDLEIMWGSEKSFTEDDVMFDESPPTTAQEVSDSVDIVFHDSNAPAKEVEVVESVVASQRRRPTSKECNGSDETERERPCLLFIQMEYCERGTLRQLIDTHFFVAQPDVIWRMFSEILSGLQYIHQQSMIHRDIKPMNIFLDSHQSVKIGDFGLATREFLLNKKTIRVAADTSLIGDVETANVKSGSAQTRDIGTELYMAPELLDASQPKTPYTAKIDVFSAGVVLFEMFYRPLLPGMERITTLKALKSELVIPQDFGQVSPTQTASARRMIEAMLDKDPERRPTVAALLSDESLPSNETEDELFKKQFTKVMKRKNKGVFKWLMDAVFHEDVNSVANYCFDVEICKERFQLSRDSVIEGLRGELSAVLQAHSFELLHTHTLVPAPTARAAAPVRLKPAELLDPAGLPLALPIDLRQNFVRYCARNAVNRFKRYNFGRVYSTDDTRANMHPYERWECSVDCIGPQPSSTTLVSELLVLACEVVSVTLKGVKAVLRIGHVNLVEAALRHLTIPDDARSSVLTRLHSMSTGDRVLTHAEKVAQLSEVIGGRYATSLFSILPVEPTLPKFKDACRTLSKSRDSTVQATMRHVLDELETASEILAIGLSDGQTDKRVTVVYDSTTSYRPTTFGDGLVFQMFVEVPRKKQGTVRQVCVLAGGRYDSLLLRERHPRDIAPAVPRFMAGFAVFMDVIAQIRKVVRIERTTSSCLALVCSYGQPLLSEKFKLARALWTANVPTDVLHEPVNSLVDLQEHCDKKSIAHLLVVFNAQQVLVRQFGVDHGKVDTADALRMVLAGNAAAATTSATMAAAATATTTPLAMSSSTSRTTAAADDEHIAVATTPSSGSRSSTSMLTLPATAILAKSMVNVNVTLALAERVGHVAKKRIEGAVRTHLGDAVNVFAQRTLVEVIACDLPADLIRSIVGELTRHSSKQEVLLLLTTLARQHGKSKLDLDAVCSQLAALWDQHQLHATTTTATSQVQVVVVLYRHVDNFYKMIL